MKKEFISSGRNASTMLTALFLTMLFACAVFAQTTAFTYQGRLSDGTNVANGGYDLQFALFDAETGGTQIGTTISQANVNVSNGVFSVSLNFGASPFAAGANRFLQIAVKKPSETSYTILTPRQPLTASPYSIRTLSATAADALSTACVGCVTNAQINSVDGSKVTGTVPAASVAQTANQATFAQTANSATTATSAQTATTATTAGNVTGVVAIANGGTGSSSQNFVDLTTNQTVGGNKTFTGTLSGAGISNLVRVVSFNGSAGISITGGSSIYVFVGPTTAVTLAANQRMTGAATAALGKTAADTQTAYVGICYQSTPGSAPINFVGGNYTIVQFSATRLTYSATGSVSGLAAGNYNVGYCVQNVGATAINNNDFVNGWVMVTNN